MKTFEREWLMIFEWSIFIWWMEKHVFV
jgi:hypothetical protein